MEYRQVRYPIGEQSFERLRKEGFLYVDKTSFIEKIVKGSKYYFLGRPRRFGKSLFLSTLKAFYEGKRELFKDLYVDSMDWDWEEYPVIYIDLNNQQFKEDKDFSDLDVIVDETLKIHEERLGIKIPNGNHSARLAFLIRKYAECTGKSVVILVDEYDKPLVNNIGDYERFTSYRNRLAALYSNFKSSAEYLKLVFLTGVSRFGKLSVFSGLNNISDISFDEDFSAICGITESELIENFQEGILDLSKKYNRSVTEEIACLKRHYDGYHFSEDCLDIYNPFSVLQVFGKRRYNNYWISSGNSTLLAEQLLKTDTDLSDLINRQCAQSDLEGLEIEGISPLALLYQTGYLTIKEYDMEDDLYTLGLPNLEVKQGFFEQLIPWYTSIRKEKN